MAGKKKKSTTRSGTSLESPDRYTFFLDRALESYSLRDALKQLGLRVEMHNYSFDADAEDVDWLPVVARREWVILSKDQFNWLERQAIRNARVGHFFSFKGAFQGAEQVSIICKAIPHMLQMLDKTSAPFIAKIHKSSKVVLMPEELPRRPSSRR
jgi:hypothetical protein